MPTMFTLRTMAGPTIKAWRTLFPETTAAQEHELREALAAYGQMLFQNDALYRRVEFIRDTCIEKAKQHEPFDYSLGFRVAAEQLTLALEGQEPDKPDD